jgi:hypothetical protein
MGNPCKPVSKVRARALVAALACVLAAATLARADERIKNRVAEFYGIDKITGRIISFDVYVDETVRFGQLHVTPRVCYSRPASETPKTTAFLEVDEITLDRQIRRIFTGWMFADSPGLNAIEHPVFDIWLKDCKQQSDEVPPPQKETYHREEGVPAPALSNAKKSADSAIAAANSRS